jgi:ribosomal protein L11 methyltransferase
MYSLRLTCWPEQVDLLSGELWEAGTAGIREVSSERGIQLFAAFEKNSAQCDLLKRFAQYAPEWGSEGLVDWVRYTHEAWRAQEIGEKLFLAPAWNADPTPEGRERIIHNPGLACGTGEHPSTKLALRALEECVSAGDKVVDVGTGSGILAIAALRLGAAIAIGIDLDEAALQIARENFSLNKLTALLAAGSPDALADRSADITIANINATVLLSLLDELLRITRDHGWLILTGFTEAELPAIQAAFASTVVSAINEWRCVAVNVS